MIPGRVDVITMGCSKNLVDSERLLKRLEAKGYQAYHDDSNVKGEYVVVNTCGFIGDAKEESINIILSLAEAKSENKIGQLIVMGCLSERYRNELEEQIPEVDSWYGKFDWDSFVDSLPDISAKYMKPEKWERSLSTPPYSAYLKISEGCDRMCAYCAIPLITGRHHSRPVKEIVEEVKKLVSEGVKEFNVIAQDLSAYGHDIYGESRLAFLIDAIADIKGVEWIRLHYAYPADFPMDILEVMKRRDNVCNYLDIALQHISDNVLKAMRRHVTKEETLSLIDEIRKRVPDIRIRTTVMTGFPGETEEDFKELEDFVISTEFDRLGGFAYCEEDDTWAARHLDDSIPEEIKNRRLERILELQEKISRRLHEKLIGKDVKVLIELVGDKEAVGRTEWDSPEVDPVVIVNLDGKSTPEPGDFITVRITSADSFELRAEQV